MRTLKIECENVNIDTKYHDKDIAIILDNPEMRFIEQLEIDEIIGNIDNEKLFKAIIDNDDTILQKYLKDNGFGRFYTKA